MVLCIIIRVLLLVMVCAAWAMSIFTSLCMSDANCKFMRHHPPRNDISIYLNILSVLLVCIATYGFCVDCFRSNVHSCDSVKVCSMQHLKAYRKLCFITFCTVWLIAMVLPLLVYGGCALTARCAGFNEVDVHVGMTLWCIAVLIIVCNTCLVCFARFPEINAVHCVEPSCSVAPAMQAATRTDTHIITFHTTNPIFSSRGL